MLTTPVGLLLRLQNAPDPDGWREFVSHYWPLLLRWATRLGVQESDAADLVQDTLITVYQKLSSFVYDQGGSFEAWIYTLLLNKWRDAQRHRGVLPVGGQVSDFAGPDTTEQWVEGEYRRHLVNRAMLLVQKDFQPKACKACWETTAGDRTPAEVAAELGMSVKAVYLARARVLRRLRQFLEDLSD